MLMKYCKKRVYQLSKLELDGSISFVFIGFHTPHLITLLNTVMEVFTLQEIHLKKTKKKQVYFLST